MTKASNIYRLPQTETEKRLLATTKRIVIARGGTRSGKTYSILKIIARWLFTGILRNGEYLKAGTALVVRKHAATISGTALQDFEAIALSVAAAFNVPITYNKTNRAFSFQGRTVKFIGADDQQKLRGVKSNILFCNEANELSYKKEFFQLLVRCTGTIFLDFNPSDPYVWINGEIEQKRANTIGDVDVVVSTYKDNQFLNKAQIAEIENLQNTDPVLWMVYGLGQYGKVEGLIYPDMQIVVSIPKEAYFLGIGLDFGFTNSYTAAYEVHEWKPNKLYLKELIYKRGLTDADVCEELESLNVSKNTQIVADSAQPGSIQTIKRKGYNISPAKKGNDSVRHGINLLKTYKLHATGDSQGVIREQKMYKYKQHSNGEWINEPDKGEDHAWDAIRYLVSSVKSKKRLSYA